MQERDASLVVGDARDSLESLNGMSRWVSANLIHREKARVNLLKPLTNPAYMFRPWQMVRRVKRVLLRSGPGEFETVALPWGARLRVKPTEIIGATLWAYGIFDLIVCEAICRLLAPSEVAVDIGANIGQMTSLMCCRAGKGGRVIAFEPHPELFSELRHNVTVLQSNDTAAPAELHNAALSDVAGEALLDVGPAWTFNRGVSKLTSAHSNSANPKVEVTTKVLDQVLGDVPGVAVCKIDVEGHEMSVLKGATRLLRSRRVRDIIFEDLGAYPSQVHQLLVDYGFTVFSLHTRLLKPRLAPAQQRVPFQPEIDGPNYLATLDPDRAISRFAAPGWRALRRIKSYRESAG
jgi:FkbM family methyltransferase